MKKLNLKDGSFWLSLGSIILGVGSTIIANMQQKENIAKEVAKLAADQAKES